MISDRGSLISEMKTRLTLIVFLSFYCSISYSQTVTAISDSMNSIFKSKGFSPSTLESIVMRTDGISDSLNAIYNPQIKIVMLDSSELMGVIKRDQSKYKIVLLWSCWSKSGVAERMQNKYLFDTIAYAIYLVSADLNNEKQRNVINRFLTSLGVSRNIYQLNSKLELTDLQNTKAATTFIQNMTGGKGAMIQLNACVGIPYALIYDRDNKLIKTLDGHFSFAELKKFMR